MDVGLKTGGVSFRIIMMVVNALKLKHSNEMLLITDVNSSIPTPFERLHALAQASEAARFTTILQTLGCFLQQACK